ncbi:unnamed protein product [Orchesella dallaii]|uniref:Uncharacterized protein n=1 Tax=Orchesella dallaii TaxID=48710 RepID=A0ABP1RVP0_9HEXA
MERASKTIIILNPLESARRRTRNAAFFHLMLTAMSIPLIIFWIIMPCFYEENHIMVDIPSQPIEIHYGEVFGWRLLYPMAVVIYSSVLIYFCMGTVYSADKNPEKESLHESRDQVENAVNSLLIHSAILKWELLNFVACALVYITGINSARESNAFMCFTLGRGLWNLARKLLVERIKKLAIELGKATPAESYVREVLNKHNLL